MCNDEITPELDVTALIADLDDYFREAMGDEPEQDNSHILNQFEPDWREKKDE